MLAVFNIGKEIDSSGKLETICIEPNASVPRLTSFSF